MLTDVGLLVLMPELQWIKYVLPRFPKMAQMGRIKKAVKSIITPVNTGSALPNQFGVRINGKRSRSVGYSPMRGYGGSSLLELTHNRWSFTQPWRRKKRR